MMSCKEASRLISEGMDRSLSWRERGSLGFHLTLCRVCTAYKKQLEIISRIARRAGEVVLSDSPSAVALSADARQRIKSKIAGSD